MVCNSLVNWLMIYYLLKGQSTKKRYLITQKKNPSNVPHDQEKNPKQKSNMHANQHCRENTLKC